MRRIGKAIVAAGLCTTLAVASAANATSTAREGPSGPARVDDGDLAASRLAADSDPELVVNRNGRGVAEFVATRTGNGVDNPARGDKLGPAASAEAHIDRYGAMFGLRKGSSTEVVDSRRSGSGGSVVRMQQSMNGLPVIGGELVVSMDAEGDLTSILAETTQSAAPAATSVVSEAKARATAIAATAKYRGGNAATLRAERGTKWLYDPAIIGATDILGARAVWRFEVSNGFDVREFVLVDASSGRIALHFNQIAHALNRGICDNNNVPQVGFVDCTSGFAKVEGGPDNAVADVESAYDFSGATSELFDAVDGVDLTNLIGVVGTDSVKRLTSTVNWCFTPDIDTCPMQNAFWNGTQMFYGQDYASADDVVGHELTHGYTEKTSNLLYFHQSGAINESMSDVIGEIVDHRTTRVVADDTWRIGEDLPISAIRNMSNPPEFNDPDRMRSPNYETDIFQQDNGGVHFNSGVGNKTAFLISQGGTFNGQTITGIDGGDPTLEKTAHLYVDVIAALTSGSDYADLGRVLSATCNGYVAAGSFGVTAANCTNVRKAILATELALQPVDPDAQATEAGTSCPAGTFRRTLYTDNVDTSGKTWSKGALWSTPPNAQQPSNATSGKKSYFGWDPAPEFGEPQTSTLTSGNNVAIPGGQKSYLHFKHWYFFEYDPKWSFALLADLIGPFVDVLSD